jgi:hypothetical protein|tara:strand:+ start:1813 stop:2163 length:351 start_codon:yes stop_codon:yes gene_type:complete
MTFVLRPYRHDHKTEEEGSKPIWASHGRKWFCPCTIDNQHLSNIIKLLRKQLEESEEKLNAQGPVWSEDYMDYQGEQIDESERQIIFFEDAAKDRLSQDAIIRPDSTFDLGNSFGR